MHRHRSLRCKQTDADRRALMGLPASTRGQQPRGEQRMEYNDNAQLDTSQVQDDRGGGGGGGGGLGILLTILALVFGVGQGGGTSTGLSGGLGSLQNQSTQGEAPNTSLSQNCQTGADANAKEDCRIVADINSVQKFWQSEFA